MSLIPNIYLDMYSSEFRKGYDASCVISAMRQLNKSTNEEGNLDAMFVRVHRDSISVVEGLISENLFTFEHTVPPGVKLRKQDLETWIKIEVSKGRQ